MGTTTTKDPYLIQGRQLASLESEENGRLKLELDGKQVVVFDVSGEYYEIVDIPEEPQVLVIYQATCKRVSRFKILCQHRISKFGCFDLKTFRKEMTSSFT